MECRVSLTKAWEYFRFKVKYNENNARTIMKNTIIIMQAKFCRNTLTLLRL